jgi:hypothetical protein
MLDRNNLDWTVPSLDFCLSQNNHLQKRKIPKINCQKFLKKLFILLVKHVPNILLDLPW